MGSEIGCGRMSDKPIPEIESAYLNIDFARRQCCYMQQGWGSFDVIMTEIKQAIEALQSAEAKVERHIKKGWE